MAFFSWVFSRDRKPEGWLEAQKAHFFYPATENKCFLPWFELCFHAEGSQNFFSFCLSHIPPTWRKTNKRTKDNQKISTFIQINCHVCLFLAKVFKLGCALTLYLSTSCSKWPNTNYTAAGYGKKMRLMGTDCYRKPVKNISKSQEIIPQRASQNRCKT